MRNPKKRVMARSIDVGDDGQSVQRVKCSIPILNLLRRTEIEAGKIRFGFVVQPAYLRSEVHSGRRHQNAPVDLVTRPVQTVDNFARKIGKCSIIGTP